MDPLDTLGDLPPRARLQPQDLRWVADLVERFAPLGAPRLTVREALLGLAARALHARLDAGQPSPSRLGLVRGIAALDALLGEGMDLFIREAEHNTDHMSRGSLRANCEVAADFANNGRIRDEPPDAVSPDRPVEILVTLPYNIVAWLRAEAAKRAGPRPGPHAVPSSVGEDGTLISSQPWPTTVEEAALREHRARASDISAVIRHALRGQMDSF